MMFMNKKSDFVGNGVVYFPGHFVPTDRDVVCGWARQNHLHPGNQRFRKLIEHSAPLYVKAKTKLEKTQVIASVVHKVRRDANGGGFVKQDFQKGMWFEIGDDRARDKVGHAIRRIIKDATKKRKNSKAKQAMATVKIVQHEGTGEDEGEDEDSDDEANMTRAEDSILDTTYLTSIEDFDCPRRLYFHKKMEKIRDQPDLLSNCNKAAILLASGKGADNAISPTFLHHQGSVILGASGTCGVSRSTGFAGDNSATLPHCSAVLVDSEHTRQTLLSMMGQSISMMHTTSSGMSFTASNLTVGEMASHQQLSSSSNTLSGSNGLNASSTMGAGPLSLHGNVSLMRQPRNAAVGNLQSRLSLLGRGAPSDFNQQMPNTNLFGNSDFVSEDYRHHQEASLQGGALTSRISTRQGSGMTFSARSDMTSRNNPAIEVSMQNYFPMGDAPSGGRNNPSYPAEAALSSIATGMSMQNHLTMGAAFSRARNSPSNLAGVPLPLQATGGTSSGQRRLQNLSLPQNNARTAPFLLNNNLRNSFDDVGRSVVDVRNMDPVDTSVTSIGLDYWEDDGDTFCNCDGV